MGKKNLTKGHGEKITGLNKSDISEQKPMVPLSKKTMKTTHGKSKYDDTYPGIAYDVLSSGPLKTKCHLCVALRCARESIDTWMEKHPEFKDAVISGREKSEELFRDKIEEHAFKPTAEVNNGLIKLMAANVHGIKEELSAPVIINNNPTKTAEEEMISRGIPIPHVDSPDIGCPAPEQEPKKNPTLEKSPSAGWHPDQALMVEIKKLNAEKKMLSDKLEAKNGKLKEFGTDFNEGERIDPFGDAGRPQ